MITTMTPVSYPVFTNLRTKFTSPFQRWSLPPIERTEPPSHVSNLGPIIVNPIALKLFKEGVERTLSGNPRLLPNLSSEHPSPSS